MAMLAVDNLTFRYKGRKDPAVRNVGFSVEKGDFIVLCGKSGCGKTTLLRNLKPALAPYGELAGNIELNGKALEQISERDQAAKIGYVLQNPDNQIVTDKVWHELAFGLESLGLSNQEIRIRVAEMASFFGIQTWFRKKTDELSGGQKQILNLASVMAMQPEILILDEPTSQLDPIAASDFLEAVKKVNDEIGTTVIITEHRLEEVLFMANRIMVMEKGGILIDDETRAGCEKLSAMNHPLYESMPAAFQIYSSLYCDCVCSHRNQCGDTPDICSSRENEYQVPLSVGEGRKWLEEYFGERDLSVSSWFELKGAEDASAKETKGTAISLKDVWFRYDKNGEDVLKDLSLQVGKGEFFAILGGNGTGKSTALSVMKGLRRAYRGKVKVSGESVMLPQNPQTVFSENTIRKDMAVVLEGMKLSNDEINSRVEEMARICDITELLDVHPYDVSGGEQQRAALAKCLLLKPDILLLDEPTKGLDNHFKNKLAAVLKGMCERGMTVLAVSHDIEFCGAYADRCAMFFDGSITTSGEPHGFFAGNSFYTTAADKISRGIFTNAVTSKDVVELCRANCEVSRS